MAEQVENTEETTEDITEQSVDTAFTDAASEQPEVTPEPTPAEPAAEPAPAPEPEPPALNEELAAAAREIGLDVDSISSSDELAQLAFENLRKQQPYVSYAQQLMPHADQIQEYFNSQKAPQPQQEEKPAEGEWDSSKYFQEKYGAPKWKDEYSQAIQGGYVQRDEATGAWKASPGYELMVAGMLPELNAAQQHTQQFWQNMSSQNPYENFYNVLQEPIMREVERRVNEIMQGRESQSRSQTAVEAFEEQHRDWLYATDPTSGQRVPTDAGQQFFDTVAELRDEGITDPAKLLSRASQIHGIGKEPPAAEAPPAEAEPEQAKENFLEGALKRAAHSPSARQRGGDEVPQVATEGDLNSHFLRAWRESQSA